MIKTVQYFSITLCFFIFPILLNGQSQVSGVIKGLKQGDTATIIIQKGAENVYYKRIGGVTNNSDVAYSFSSLSNGKWALSIDAKGYIFPAAKVITLNNNNLDITFTLTSTISANYNLT